MDGAPRRACAAAEWVLGGGGGGARDAGPGGHRRRGCTRGPGAPNVVPGRGAWPRSTCATPTTRCARRRWRRCAPGGGDRRGARRRGGLAGGQAAPARGVRRRADRRRCRPRRRAGVPVVALASGAGHDAVVLAALTRRRDAVRALRRRRQPPPRRVRGRGRRAGGARRARRLRPRAGAVSDFDLVIRGDERVDSRWPTGGSSRSGPSSAAPAREEVDARGLLVLPGVRRRPRPPQRAGRADWEGFATGTAALAAGGDDVRDRHAAQRGAADASTAPPSTPRSRGRAGVRARGLRAVGRARPRRPPTARRARGARRRRLQGLHVGQRGRGLRGRRRPDAARGDGAGRRAGPAGRRARRERGAHAPAWAPAPWPTGARRARLAGLAARGGRVEAIARAIHLAAATGCALHVVHVSSGRGVALVAEARARGVDVSCETCPHYLVLDEEDAERLGAVAKCAPPLRPAAERGGAVGGAAGRATSMVASDHSPVAAGAEGRATFFAAWGGIAGAQTTLALRARRGRLGAACAPEAAGRALAAPGARFGLAPARARSRPGADADLVLVDRRRRGRCAREELHERHRLSPFVGRDAGAAAWCGRSCAGARSRSTGGPWASPAGAWCDRRLGLCAVSALDDAIAELAEFNDDPGAGGITREVYTPTYATALEWVAERMRAAGPRDAARRRGQPLRAAGRAASPSRRSSSPARTWTRRSTPAATTACSACSAPSRRCARCASAASRPRRSIDVVAWAGEEPRFGTGCVGSRAAAGALERADLDRLRDRDGTSMADALRGAGFDPDRLAEARIDPGRRARARRAAHRAGHRARDPRRADRRRHRDRGAARLPPDLPRRRHPRGRHADGPAPRRAGRRGRGDGRPRARRPRVAQRDDRRHGRRDAGAPRGDQRRPGRGRARRRRARQRPRRARARRRRRSCRRARDRGAARPRRSRSTPIVEDMPVACDAAVVAAAEAACRELGLSLPPDDQRRLPRRDDHGRRVPGRDDLRPQRRRRQPPPRRVHRARGARARACRCWPGRWRGWRPDGDRPRRRSALRGAYCRIEGRRVAVAGALAAQRSSAVLGAESLRTSSAFRNTFGGRPGGWSLLCTPQMHKSDHPSGRLQRCCETRAIAHERRTRLRTTTRAANRPQLLPLDDAVRRCAAPHAPADEAASRQAAAQRGALGFAASVSAAAAPSREMRTLTP